MAKNRFITVTRLEPSDGKEYKDGGRVAINIDVLESVEELPPVKVFLEKINETLEFEACRIYFKDTNINGSMVLCEPFNEVVQKLNGVTRNEALRF